MKKIILLYISYFFIVLTSLNAQSLAGYKIYINPGHGGHDSDDRNMPQANFWESESNLSKGLHLRDILISLGATVYMSRTTNTTADDLPLSQIAEGANSNNVDYFHSIHSNAFNAASNYTLLLFNGYDQTPKFPKSKEMGAIMVSKINSVNRTTSISNRGDYNFYGWKDANGNPTGLGVLNPLAMPGTLSEGSFHDYTPETWRLKNDSYLKHEAWAIARSFLQYFNAGSFQKGIVAGIVRDDVETVPASYNPISSTNDRYKPLNKIKVRLEPGGRVYNGDDFNNGYYFFDDVTPGNYKLYFDYAQMKTDSASVVVKANESVFADKFMILNPILDPPVVDSYSPADNSSEVSNVTSIVINFSIRMNTTETEKAITISPSVTGSFKWENDYKKVIFTPAKGYIPGAKHTVTIATSAKTHFGINLLQANSFSFITRAQLNLVSTYPATNAVDISTTVMMRLQFDKGIDGSTMAYKITVTDSTGTPVKLKANISRYSLGIIDFETEVPLNNNTAYTITVKEGIGDVEYVLFPKTVTIAFRTEKKYTFTGNLLEGFENANIWQSIFSSPNTQGINTSQSSFVIYNLKKREGENSGKLDYSFSGTTGSVELALLNPIVLGESSASGFGIWIFGDNSNNVLEYRFLRPNEEKVKLDTINWTGWKLKQILLDQIPGSGTIKFKSIVVLQTAKGSLTGRLYFDECVGNIITGVKENNYLPTEFSLAQNFPNPFNPSTTIRYSIPEVKSGNAVPTIIKVYDLLGREIATLVNEEKTPGYYEVTFNGIGLASGMYIYRIQSGNFVESKKLILLK